MANIDGSSSNDTLYGSTDDDVLQGFDGDDDLNGDSGNDDLYGGAGHDTLTGYGAAGQQLRLYGGDGDDHLDARTELSYSVHYDPETYEYIQVIEGGRITVEGGAGDDRIFAQAPAGEIDIDAGAGDDWVSVVSSYQPAQARVDLGAGDDSIRFDAATVMMLTTGTGRDTITVTGWGAHIQSTSVVLDFTAGAGGDLIDLAPVLDILVNHGWTGEGNPFAEDLVRLVQDGDDTLIEIDLDGQGSDFEPLAYLRLNGVQAATLTGDNFLPPFPPDGSPVPSLELTGTEGADDLPGGFGNDLIAGGAGDDTIAGSAGDDSLSGDAGNDWIAGGTGDDTLDGGAGHDVLSGDSGNDLLRGGEGDDSLYGGGGAGDDALYGGAGNDYLDDVGNATIDGGTGNDEIYAYGHELVISGGEGDDTIDASLTDFWTYSEEAGANVVVSATALVTGGAGHDQITVRGDVESQIDLQAGAGNDTVSVYGGNGRVDLGTGDDLLQVNTASALEVTGGAGADIFRVTEIAYYTDSLAVVLDFATEDQVDLSALLPRLQDWDGVTNPFATGHLQLVQVGDDTLLQVDLSGGGDDFYTAITLRNTQVETMGSAQFLPPYAPDGSAPVGLVLTGTDGDDLLFGDIGPDTISGGAGDDLIEGGGQNDLLSGEAGHDEISGGGGDDTLYGGSGNDTLTGGQGDDSLDGGDGDDQLSETGGGSNVLSGGNGDDDLYLEIYAQQVEFQQLYGGGGNDRISTNSFGADLLVDGGDGDDNLDLRFGPNSYNYGYGNAAEGGQATITGGAGRDTLSLSITEGGHALVDMGSDNDRVILHYGTATVTLGEGRDDLVLSGGNARATVTDFSAGAGGDRIDLTQLLYNSAQQDLTLAEAFAQGIFTLQQQGPDTHLLYDPWGDGAAVVAILRNIDADDLLPQNFLPAPSLIVTGTVDEDHILGDFGNDSLTGLDGDDTLEGLEGDDTLDGGLGDDLLQAGAGNDDLVGGGGNDTLLGGEGDDILEAVGARLELDGGAGNDTLYADHEGEATLAGGAGDDLIHVRSWGGDLEVSGGDGDDTINLRLSQYYYYDDEGQLPSNVTVAGGAGNDEIVINSFVDTLLEVSAGAGDDFVSFTGAGRVEIDLGSGDDTIQLNWGTQVRVTTGDGRDLIILREMFDQPVVVTDFTTGAAGDRIDLHEILESLARTGWPGGNPFATGYLRLVQSGADTLLVMDDDGALGSTAVDRILVRFEGRLVSGFTAGNFEPAMAPDGTPVAGLALAGGTGADTLAGGIGHDTLNGGAGHDRLEGSHGQDSLVGGTGEDSLFGGSGNDTLLGGADNDSLYGGLGDDLLEGGSGDDYISDSSGNDTALGGEGEDYIDLSGGHAEGGADNDHISLSYGGVVYGDGGDDTITFDYAQGSTSLYGGLGDDQIAVTWGYEADATILVDGGEGNDTIHIRTNFGQLDVRGGAGDDSVTVYTYAEENGRIDLGAGNDTLTILATGAMEITTGAGRDLIILDDLGATSGLVFTDFTTGAGGDVLDVDALLQILTRGNWPGGNPFTSGYLTLVANGSDTELRLDIDGNAGPADRYLVATFRNLAPSDFTAANFLPTLIPAGDVMPGLVLEGGNGSDDLSGGIGHDRISGLAGHDTLSGGYGADSLYGGAGDDELRGGHGADLLEGGEGNDSLYGGTGRDTLQGGLGDDFLIASSGLLEGGDGQDHLVIDELIGQASLYGGQGYDSIYAVAYGDDDGGLASAITVEGGEGNDSISAYLTGTDFEIGGGSGDDWIFADLRGSDGQINLGDGRDYLIVHQRFGDSPVRISTGAGADRVELHIAAGAAGVEFTDFTTGTGGDLVNLYDMLNTAYDDDWDGRNPFTDGYLRLMQVGADTRLLFDGDAGGGQQERVIATFLNTTATAFTAANFAGNFQPVVSSNQAPVLVHALADVTRAEDAGPLEIQIPANAFNDVDGDALTLSARLVNGDALPTWLSFDAATGRFTGTPPAHFNGTLSIRVTASDGQAATSDSFDLRILAVNDAPTGRPVLLGNLTEDQTLTVDTSGIGDVDGLGAFSYQWLRDGAAIGGATSSSYRLVQADVGAAISVQLRYVDGDGTTETVVSTGSGPVANVNDAPTGAPVLTGTARYGELLGVTTGTIADEDGMGSFSYQWLRDGAVIGGATSASYRLIKADVAAEISVRVSYTDGQGTRETLLSPTSAAVINVNDAPTGTPVLTGLARQGQTLGVNTAGIGDGDGLGAFSYQWLRDGAVINGATSSSYGLSAADIGAEIAVRVSYTDGLGTVETLVSTESEAVTAANSAPTGTPVLTGLARLGQTLGVNTTGIGDADGLGAFSYQWLRNGVAIGGATASSYRLDRADLGAGIAVRISYTDGEGTRETLVSPSSAAVAHVNSAPTGVPVITGAARFGSTLTVNTAAIRDADGLGGFSYQWLRNGTAISGATAASYRLAEGDVGHAYALRISYTDGLGTRETLISAATTRVVLAAVTGGNGNDNLNGSGLGDKMSGLGGNDRLFGLAGNDTIDGGAGADLLDGGAGNDSLIGGAGADTLLGQAGNDRMDGGTDADSLNGGLGNDTLLGAGGNDTLIGAAGNDSLLGGAGNDRLLGDAGNDTLNGEAGNDNLQGGVGKDLLSGGGGNDSLLGGTENDTLAGGAGKDSLAGEAGNDRLSGEAGNDTLTGGAGADQFVFSAGDDIITDFNKGQKDRLLLSDDLWSGKMTAKQIVQTYGEVVKGGVMLEFDSGDSITIRGITSLNALVSQIDVI